MLWFFLSFKCGCLLGHYTLGDKNQSVVVFVFFFNLGWLGETWDCGLAIKAYFQALYVHISQFGANKQLWLLFQPVKYVLSILCSCAVQLKGGHQVKSEIFQYEMEEH